LDPTRAAAKADHTWAATAEIRRLRRLGNLGQAADRTNLLLRKQQVLLRGFHPELPGTSKKLIQRGARSAAIVSCHIEQVDAPVIGSVESRDIRQRTAVSTTTVIP
jgi:hypothetical protein